MSGLLSTLARDGYRFRLDHDKVIVRGPTDRLSPAALDQLRQKKPEILAELRLEAFIDLVRVTAACEHGIVLHHDPIVAQLDQDDIAELLTNTREDRQAWAGLLAYRLTRSRIAS
jgi:hypothetical protein